MDQNCVLGHLPRPTDSADLLKLAKFSKSHGLAKNDINGALYHFTKSMVNKFCERLTTHNLVFHVRCSFGSALPAHIKKDDPQRDWGFDRIELGMSSYEGMPNNDFIGRCKNNVLLFLRHFKSY